MTREERNRYEKNQMQTFLAVRNALKKSGNALAYNMCYKTPWRFYGTHSADECVRILLDKYS